MMTVSLYYSGLSGLVTGGHLHGPAAPGENAEVLFSLNPTPGTSGSVVNVTFALTPSHVADLKAGRHYLDLHSSGFLDGEIRGQLTVDPVMTTTLSGQQQVPGNASQATGRGFVSLNALQTQALVTLRWNDLTNAATVAHLHSARSGVNGEIVCELMPPAAVSGEVVDVLCNLTPAQASLLKARGLNLNLHSTAFPDGEIRGQLKRTWNPCDFEGDGRSDPTVVRNTGTRLEWWIRLSSGGMEHFVWGLPQDFNSTSLLCPDVDGDGKADATVWRSGTPSVFWSRLSTGGMRTQEWGREGDDPRMIGDYDGDGKDDYTVYRASTPSAYWILESSTGAVRATLWGTAGDLPLSTPDYDGDGRTDFGVRRGAFTWQKGSTGVHDALFWGVPSDASQSADYDGDGRSDVIVSRPYGIRQQWWTRSSLTGEPLAPYGNGYAFGCSCSVPRATRTTADFDGDGRVDIAVWMNSYDDRNEGAWWIQSMRTGLTAIVWGIDGDLPVQATYWR